MVENQKTEAYRGLMSEYLRGLTGAKAGYFDIIGASPQAEPADSDEIITTVMGRLAKIRGDGD